ncbi:Hint domain-containing protein [uncultured Litoreibacter sp.]|uniref:Hint domain-containing protein n=1 Tax=uncultured Litoreibacter sp. TaxID=1392394 RepID=UPI002617EE84|nr:Hint domain-containing protein [uncultured Litoreibacter sp.]
MPTVTGYLIFSDMGAAGPSNGDLISGGGATTSFDTSSYNPEGTAVVNYPSTVGDSAGMFYDVGGSFYFVPDDATGFPTGEAGTVTDYIDAIYGTTGADTLNGTAGGELIQDTDGDIYAGTGDDTINAAGGNDTVIFGDGNDVIYGGDGDDVIGSFATGSGTNTIYGDAGNDSIIGGMGDDTIYGGTGDDYLTGAAGNDWIYGGDGADVISVTDDHDVVNLQGGEGGTDWDHLTFANYTTTQGVTVTFDGWESGSYTFDGSSTNGSFSQIEELSTTEYDDTVNAASTSQNLELHTLGGADTVTTGSGSDLIFAGDGDDVVNAAGGDDVVDAGAGDDTIYGGEGDDSLTGGSGADMLHGGAGTDTLIGNDGNDRFHIEDDDGTSIIDGGGWWDTIMLTNVVSTQGVSVTYTGNEAGTFDFDGTSANDSFQDIEEIWGTWDYGDTIDASADGVGIKTYTFGGDDTVTGGSGDDRIYLGEGEDVADGGTGQDQLFGEDGDDILTGGAGDDQLTGGAGDDIFVYADGAGNDIIYDFDMGDPDDDGFTNDQLDVSGLTNASSDPVTYTDVTVTDDGSGNAVLSFPNGESITLFGVSPASVTLPALHSMGVPCFTSGTLNRTPFGDRLVETLKAGDLVDTADNGPQQVMWVGQTDMSEQELRDNPKARPVLIKKGALGNSRDMLVSRQHGMVACPRGGPEQLVRAIHLARKAGAGFRVAHGVKKVTYVHLLFAQHQIVFAENCPSESFYPGPMGLAALSSTQRMNVLSLLPVLALGAIGLESYGATARTFCTNADMCRDLKPARDNANSLERLG